jgi:predicted lipoprotein with Yx(FWY)xxD motif
MNRVRLASLAVLLSAGAMALAACGPGVAGQAQSSGGATASLTSALHYLGGTAKQNNAPKNTGDFFPGQRNDPAALKWVQLTAGKAGDLNPVVLDGAGFTLYRFDKDTPNPSASNCNGACAMTWPPVLVQPGSKVFIDGVDKSQIGVIKRADGTLQLTVGKWPIYRFSGDSNPGQTNGENVGGTWFGVTPTGGKALPPGGLPASGAASATPSTGSTGSTGSGSSSTSTSSSGDTSVVLFDDANFADNGSQGLSGSTGCENVGRPNVASSLQLNGAPIKIWTGPNCTGTSQVLTTGVADLANIGFDNDIQSIRFGVSASSGSGSGTTTTTTTAPPASTTTSDGGATSGSGDAALGNGSAILDTGTNFQEPNGSFGVAGPGCQAVPSGNLVQSLQLAGGPIKLWTAANCTGTSVVVSSSVADLNTIGFSDKIASIRFGG